MNTLLETQHRLAYGTLIESRMLMRLSLVMAASICVTIKTEDEEDENR
jgi:hypothetical protein